ncbi:hypothetical protein [Streptomyces sp. MBT53]|uniref:hypothetical protein n=1 Tax=Streptomyces sp. MBT53 TaxID=1488384 RepID=UPI001914A390|nr:hypothetical protein [Streptomyces sp. MBT53]MBK6018272.1 hypothetical protein [Streptomyces sp. MBT53]
MKGSRAWLVVLMCGLVPVAVGCTADGAARAGGSAGASVTASASPSCARGAIHWVRTTKETELLAVSPVVEVAKTDGKVRFAFSPVRSVTPAVEVNDASVSDGRVFAALARRLDVDASVLRKPSSEQQQTGSEIDFLGAAGRFVEARGADVVRASFTVDCPAANPVHGSVTGYYGSSGASLQCGVDPGKAGGKASWVREAYDMTCGRS